MITTRDLVSTEQAMEVLNRRATSFNVVTTSRLKEILRENVVRKAVEHAQTRHPYLNYRIVGSLERLRFELAEIPQIPLRLVSNFSGDVWQTIVQTELNTKIESDRVLMRIVLVHPARETNSSYLITTVHHAICDGLSSMALHLDILTYCQKIASKKLVISSSNLSALPPLPALLPTSMQKWRGIFQGILFLLRSQFQISRHKPQALKFEKYLPIESRRCGVIHQTLDEKLVPKLIHSCRQQQTTVQGALCAAMLLAVSDRLIGNKSSQQICLNCQSYVDLRRQIKPAINNEHLGMLASALQSFHTLTIDTEFWDLAREIRQHLTTSLKGKDIFCAALMFRKIVEDFLKNTQSAPATVAVTNIGRVSLSQNNLPNLEEISFAVGQGAYGGIFAVAASTFQEKMCLNFLFSEPSVSRDTAEILANLVVAKLSEVIL